MYIEETTRTAGSVKPSKPDFNLQVQTHNSLQQPQVKVIWLPNLNDKPGSMFYVQYREAGKPDWMKTDPELYEDFIIVSDLESGKKYEFRVVAQDGEEVSFSDIKETDTYNEPTIKPSDNLATAGWFIGMMLAIALLLLILIMVCILKRNRGGKYAVHEREQANGRHDYPDEGGFHEYSQP